MAIYIEDLHIGSFRGIKRMDAEGLNHVNLIVGDNNCGKTSVLEAALLLRNPMDFSNVLRIARMRDLNNTPFSGRTSAFECFYNLFPQPSEEPYIHLRAQCGRQEAECTLRGKWTSILLEESDIAPSFRAYARRELHVQPECKAFVGRLDTVLNGCDWAGSNITFHEYSKITGLEINKHPFLNMLYLSPIDHVKSNVISRIVKNEDYKSLCLRVVQLFDPDISDLVILKNEQTNRPVEYIKHNILGLMPVSTYGDGVKRVLLLSNAIVQAMGGVLLIDEVETAIHSQYYSDVFQFLLKACKRFKIQLFITTHNIEAFDALLDTQRYDQQARQDDVTVLTLKKTQTQTLIRNMSGREVSQNREAFDFEVRI